MDRVIYKDYIVNRRFFMYCSLACTVSSPKTSHEVNAFCCNNAAQTPTTSASSPAIGIGLALWGLGAKDAD